MRRSEAVNMRWEQINGNRWTIPETKNGKSHIVTLHPLALSLLKTQRIISEGGWVFESLSKPSFPVTGDAITRALERLKTKYMAEVAPFSPHDLRRSIATGCAEYLDAPERLIELVKSCAQRQVNQNLPGRAASGKITESVSEMGDFIEHEIIESDNGTPDNVIQISFGKR